MKTLIFKSSLSSPDDPHLSIPLFPYFLTSYQYHFENKGIRGEWYCSGY